MHFVYLILGSNLGDSRSTFQKALSAVEKVIGKRVRLSAIYETTPWGVVDQPNYLNQVVKIETALSASEVLFRMLKIEEQLGRVRREKWGARVIDIDILYFDDCIIDEPNLKIPHPLLHLRKFVLVPLVEIAPAFLHPLLKKTNSTLLALVDDTTTVEKMD